MTSTKTSTKTTTVTVQLDVQYENKYIEIADISADLAKQLAKVQGEPGRVPTGESGWWTHAVRTFDEAVEPIGYQGLATSFDQLGMALDEYDDGEIDLGQLLETIREQLGEREANR